MYNIELIFIILYIIIKYLLLTILNWWLYERKNENIKKFLMKIQLINKFLYIKMSNKNLYKP